MVLGSLTPNALAPGHVALLVLALLLALAFEFVNGFHDTANAVATVIYTHSLRPMRAVAWSGLCNFLGVCLGGTAVAFGIVNMLPVDLLIDAGTGPGLAMVLALLLSATAWNLGTWALGIPCSSSHTLVGAIVGVGLANSWGSGASLGSGIRWHHAGEVGLSLLISPVIGFGLSALVFLLIRWIKPDPQLFEPPPADQPPPRWIRATLIVTCTGVSLAHGSNDGQKGVGLIMLILIGLLPAHYALNLNAEVLDVTSAVTAIGDVEELISNHEEGRDAVGSLGRELAELRTALEGNWELSGIPAGQRWQVRARILRTARALSRRERELRPVLTVRDRELLLRCRRKLVGLTEYAPDWVLAMVAVTLGGGTIVGWKRVVRTVGEKIGKSHLSYAQGASAELVAMATIGLADVGGLPVSTTHVLSSGVAGTMAANRSGLQGRTVRNILLAWVLTLPVAMLLSAGLFRLFLGMVG